MAVRFGYDKDVNYQEKINEAVAIGDYKTAAILEGQRNAKIDGEGITDYQKTYNFENERKKYGYSGESRNIPVTKTVLTTVEEKPKQTPAYVNRYQDQIDSLTQKLLDADKEQFTYRDAPDYVNRYRDQIDILAQKLLDADKEQFTYRDAPDYVNRYQDQIDTLAQKLLGADKEQFTYQDAPDFVSRYQDQIDALSKEILGRGAFSYDPEQDPAYQQYRQSYTSGGQRAMQDTMGQIAARTGGLASSYAESAAQQTYDNYMGALANKIPELRQLAYQMYLDEWNGKRSELSTLQGLEQSDYDRYLTDLSQYNADRSMAYGAYRDQQSDLWRALNSMTELERSDYDRYLTGLSQYNTDRSMAYGAYRDQRSDLWRALNSLTGLEQTDYNRYRDQITDDRYTDERDYNRAVYADERDYNRGVYADERDYNRAVYADERDYNRGVYAGETAYNRGIYASETDYDRKLKRAQLLAGSGDFSGYLDLGYSDEEIARMQAAFMLQHPELSALYRYRYGGYGY